MAEDTPAARQKVESYEANIDLMALQILARLPDHPAPAQIIRAINDYIFEEMRFRFPAPFALRQRHRRLHSSSLGAR